MPSLIERVARRHMEKQARPLPDFPRDLTWGRRKLNEADALIDEVALSWQAPTTSGSFADAFGKAGQVVDRLRQMRRLMGEIDPLLDALEREVQTRKVADLNNRRIDNRTRREIAKAFKHVGLDGNGKFDRPSAGLRAALDIMETFGIVLADGLVTGVDGPQGHKNFHIAFPNPEDEDNPVEIVNSSLVFAWYRRSKEFSDIYDWEVTAYVS